MSGPVENESQSELIEGEFVTDGKTYVFRLSGTPLSGSGATPAEAMDNLLRADALSGGLSRRLRQLAREQRAETVRAAVVRSVMTALIVFGVVGGALVVTAALAPRVIGDVVEVGTRKLNSWLDAMPPEQELRIARLLRSAAGGESTSESACAADDEPGRSVE